MIEFAVFFWPKEQLRRLVLGGIQEKSASQNPNPSAVLLRICPNGMSRNKNKNLNTPGVA
jgi:hypothetical protein